MLFNSLKRPMIATSISLALLTGCNSSNDSSGLFEQTTTDIVAERGPLLNSVLQDASGNRAEEIGNGVYRFSGDIKYPIETTGGIIDLNRNGIIDEGDINTNGFQLRANSGQVVTLATTLATNETLKQKLLSDLNLSEDTLLTQRPSTDKEIAALSDEVFKFCIENNITDASTLTTAQWDALSMSTQNRMDLYSNSQHGADQLEQDLVTNELSGRLQPLLPTDADALNRMTTTGYSMDTTLASLPTYPLNDEQKQALAFLWNEEKMAKDLYLALNRLYPNLTLESIATHAETQHQLAMESLLQKYEINVEQPTDPTYQYDQSGLDSYAAGTFANADIQSLYDTLYSAGSVSSQASLEVGCKVEVTDINDLTQDIEVAGEAQDLKMVFENLRNGSYNHYWAFDDALKQQGVTEGCCALGAEFCHTDYPTNSNLKQGMANGHGMNQAMGWH